MKLGATKVIFGMYLKHHSQVFVFVIGGSIDTYVSMTLTSNIYMSKTVLILAGIITRIFVNCLILIFPPLLEIDAQYS